MFINKIRFTSSLTQNNLKMFVRSCGAVKSSINLNTNLCSISYRILPKLLRLLALKFLFRAVRNTVT
jgi:hypothetical protein